MVCSASKKSGVLRSFRESNQRLDCCHSLHVLPRSSLATCDALQQRIAAGFYNANQTTSLNNQNNYSLGNARNLA